MIMLTNTGKIFSLDGSLPTLLKSGTNAPLAMAEIAVNRQREVVRRLGDNTPIAKAFLRKLEERLEELAQEDLLQQAGLAGVA